MDTVTRLPAIPLIANDPYFSVWSPCDCLTDAHTVHWTGAAKPVHGRLDIDGKRFRFLGPANATAMTTVSQAVLPTRTLCTEEGGGVRLSLTFMTPMLPDDPDMISTPATAVIFSLTSTDGKEHECVLSLHASDALCYSGESKPAMLTGRYTKDGLNFAFCGQRRQKLLCHSGDHITIDWGYLYFASSEKTYTDNGTRFEWRVTLKPNVTETRHVWAAYDDVASILYFGTPCKAWYARGGKTLPDRLTELEKDFDTILARCEALDGSVLQQARSLAGEDYALICGAAWRQAFAAHKLIATPKGDMAFLSKENDSNGCIGTVDVAYPTVPLLLRFCPQLVNAMCRPVLEFASLPVWEYDFAPHDVGRYPIVNGQIYAYRHAPEERDNGNIAAPVYLYPAGCELYDPRRQMPVEESGNMLIMLAAAALKTSDYSLADAYRPLLDKWVQYLFTYGEDPADQLCTDDFAGHLAHNVNLSAKAFVGIACYGILSAHGREDRYLSRAKELAASWLKRAQREDATALTFDGMGWSMKYNLVWDKVLQLGLLPETFYRRETESYLPRMNTYGLPLDSRADYTKADWIAWAAALSPDKETRAQLLAPVAKFLRETPNRVPFSDWYDTNTGRYVQFMGRSVVGGMFMPFLTDR